MRKILLVSVFGLLASPACAQDAAVPPATEQQCIAEKISAAKLQQENSALRAQLMQLQFNSVQQSGAAAKAELDRLEKLQGKPAAGDPTAKPPTNESETPPTNPKAASAGVN